MSHCVVWIEHDHAKIFSYSPGNSQKNELKNSHIATHHNGHFQQEKKNALHKFYHEVAESLKGANEVLLVGPGLAKVEFKSHLEEHGHSQLAKSVIGVETMDKSTDGEIQNMAKKFFHKYNLFHT